MLRIKAESVKPCTDTIIPCIEVHLTIETDFRQGYYILIPADALVFSSDEKLLGTAIIEYMDLHGTPYASGQSLIVGAQMIGRKRELKQYTGSVRIKILLTPEVVDYLERLRISDKYQRVHIKIKLRFHELVSRYIYNETLGYIGEKHVALKLGEHLLMLPNPLYRQYETRLEIDSVRWVKEFLPALTGARRLVLELPVPSAEGYNDEIVARIGNVARSLEEASKILHETLRTGPALTALRNAVSELCHALAKIGLAETTLSGSCKFKHECIKQAFQDEELGKLIAETLSKIKRITQTAPEPTAPHLNTAKPQLHPHQVKYLITITTATIAILLETINETHTQQCKTQTTH